LSASTLELVVAFFERLQMGAAARGSLSLLREEFLSMAVGRSQLWLGGIVDDAPLSVSGRGGTFSAPLHLGQSGTPFLC
jgi:hypothetical protein